MKPKTLILVVVAVACGLGASYMTARLLAERQQPEEEKVEILVARKNLSVGERIMRPEEFFEKKAVAKNDEPPEAIKDFEALRGKAMRQSRNRGDHITPSNLIDKNRLEIPEGHHAVGLPVNLATTAHGLATLPGSRVDLLLTVRNPNDINGTFTKAIIENALVLAADGRVTPEGELVAAASVVTLALNSKDGLIATTAKDMGQLTLRLRNLNDFAKSEDDTVNGRQILEKKGHKEPEKKVETVTEPTPTPPVEVAKEPEAPKGTPYTQLIINGTHVQSLHYRKLDTGEYVWDDPNNPAPQVQPQLRPRIQPQPQPQPAPMPAKEGRGLSQDL